MKGKNVAVIVGVGGALAGAIYLATRAQAVECAIDADCPYGYECIGGKCVQIQIPLGAPAAQATLSWQSPSVKLSASLGDPQFTEGETHTATVIVTNTGTGTFAFDVALALSGFGSWTKSTGFLAPGESASLSYPVTFTTEGNWLVYVLVTEPTTGQTWQFTFDTVKVLPAYVPPTTAWGYDFNGSGYIEAGEYEAAVADYSAGLITQSMTIYVGALYAKHVRRGQMKGDFNDDGVINLSDFVAFGNCYGSSLGNNAYNPVGDFNDNGVIDASDKAAFDAVYAPPFDPWVYDLNKDGYIDTNELGQALADYFDLIITKDQFNKVDALPKLPVAGASASLTWG